MRHSRPLVLCYHALSETWPATLSVHPERFRQQLELLLDRGYEPATFSEAVRGGGRKLAVTFDDGFVSVRDLALPILERLGMPATLFAVSDFAASGGQLRWAGIDHWGQTEFAGELAGLSWSEMRALQDRGWEIGSHTATHPHLTELDDHRLREELIVSREAVSEAMGRPCASIAYPYGSADERVAEAARAAGYETGAGLPALPGARLPLLWPRVGVYHGDEMARFRLKVSPAVAFARRVVRR